MSRICIYCDERKHATAFSQEHIWPRALGGAQLPTLWKTKHVCQDCNTRMGQTIDGPCAKHPTIRNAKAYYSWAHWYAAAAHMRTTTDTVDLFFLGHCDEDMECWAAPSGARIWRSRQARTVFVDSGTLDVDAIELLGRSVYKHFKRYQLQTNCSHLLQMSALWQLAPRPTYGPLAYASPKYTSSRHTSTEAVQHQQRDPRLLLQALLAKTALGIGYQCFKQAWLQGPDIAHHRQQLTSPTAPATSVPQTTPVRQHLIKLDVTPQQALIITGSLFGLIPFQYTVTDDLPAYPHLIVPAALSPNYL